MIRNSFNKAVLLFFEYPIAVICQTLSLGAVFFGLCLSLGIGGVNELVIYAEVSSVSNTHPEYLGALVMIAGIANLFGFFFRHNKTIFIATYGMILFWLFICILYLFTGVPAATYFYVLPQVLILAYSIIYITLNKNVKISPYRALKKPPGSDIMDHTYRAHRD